MQHGYSWLETLASHSWVRIQLIKLNSDSQENKVIVPKHALSGFQSSIYVTENLEAFKQFRMQSKVILGNTEDGKEHYVPLRYAHLDCF